MIYWKVELEKSVGKSFAIEFEVIRDKMCDGRCGVLSREHAFETEIMPNVYATLEESLEEFFKPDVLPGFRHEKCSCSNPITTQKATLESLPENLIVMLRRYVIDDSSKEFCLKKVLTKCDIPVLLDLKPFSSEFALNFLFDELDI